MGLNLEKPIEWDSKLTLAAMLVAEGQLSHSEIARIVGRTPQTLSGWNCHPDFKAKVEVYRKEFVEAIEQKVSKLIIKDREHRLKRMQTDYDKLLSVRDARAASTRHSEDEVPGISSGLIVVKETNGTTKDGGSWQKLETNIDTGYLTAVQNLETQAARELGQLKDPGVSVNVKLYGGFDPEDV